MIGGTTTEESLVCEARLGTLLAETTRPHLETAYDDLHVVLTGLGLFERLADLGFEQHIFSA